MRQISLRLRLTSIVILALLPVLAWTLFSNVQLRAERGQAAREQVFHTAETIAQEQLRLFDSGRQLLVTLAQISALRHLPRMREQPTALAACHALLRDMLAQYPSYAALAALDSDGTVLCSAPRADRPVNYADYVLFQEALRTRDFVVGSYLVGRITGRPVVPLAYPILDASGEVAVILAAGLDLIWLHDFFTAISLPPGATLLVLDSTGTVLLHHPDNEKWLGQTVADEPLARAMLHGRSGTLEETGLDGVRRVYGFLPLTRPTGDQPTAYIAVGIPSAAVYGTADRELLFGFAVLGSALVLALAVAWGISEFSILRPVRRLLAATRRVAAGDLSARSNIPATAGELGALAAAFDQMTAALAERQRELAAALELNQRIIAASPLGIAIYDASGTCLTVNDAALHILETTRTEMLALNVHQAVARWAPQCMAAFSEAFERALANGEVQECDLAICLPDREVWLDMRSVPFVALEHPHLLVMFADVTRHRQAEQALEHRLQAEQLAAEISTRFVAIAPAEVERAIVWALQRIGEHMQVDRCYFGLYSADGRSVAHEFEWHAAGLAPTAHEYIGMEVTPLRWSREKYRRRETLIVSRLADLPPEADAERALWQRLGIRSLVTLPVYRGETLFGYLGFSTERTERTWHEEDLHLLGIVAEVFVNALVRAQIEEERAHLQARLLQAQKMEAIGQLTAGIAHDFNNMLTVINGFAELLQHRLAADDPAQEMVTRIRRTGRQAVGLIQQLMTLSRQQSFQPKQLNLNEVIEGMRDMLQHMIGEDIILTTHLAPDLWTVRADPQQMQQVLTNLAANARDAMPQGGQLVIETANVVLDETDTARYADIPPGEYVRLSVSDTGCGMSAEVQARAFEPYFTTKTLGRGTGLGLAIVHGIVTQSEGHIRLYSEEGHGTTFKIYLPRVPLPEEQRVAQLQDTGPLPLLACGGETILLVEDNAELRQFVRQTLEGLGYGVLEAASGEEALQLLTECSTSIPLLISDIILPGMRGSELAERLRAQWPDLRVLFISGYSDALVKQSVALDPSSDFLPKPFSARELLTRVWRLLGVVDAT